MIVECIKIDLTPDDPNYHPTYDLDIGKNYNVYGISISKKNTSYLLVDRYNASFWYPSDLFKINESSIPNNWHYGYIVNDKNVMDQTIIGFPKLLDPTFLYNLIDRDAITVFEFSQIKQEIDQFYKNITENKIFLENLMKKISFYNEEKEDILKNIDLYNFYKAIETFLQRIIIDKIVLDTDDKEKVKNIALDFHADENLINLLP